MNNQHKFCPGCGVGLETKLCINCQRVMQPEWYFCPDCGIDIEKGFIEKKVSQNPEPITVDETQPIKYVNLSLRVPDVEHAWLNSQSKIANQSRREWMNTWLATLLSSSFDTSISGDIAEGCRRRSYELSKDNHASVTKLARQAGYTISYVLRSLIRKGYMGV